MLKPKTAKNPDMPSQLNWDEHLFLQAINENQIVTRADPNTASHLQRMLRNAALYQMAKDDPGSFNVLRIRQVCIRGIGFADPDQYLNPNPAPPADPKAQAAQMEAQADLIDAQAKAAQTQHDIQWGGTDVAQAAQDRQAKIDVAKLGVQKEQLMADSQERQTATRAQTDLATTHVEGVQSATEQARDHAHEKSLGQQDHMHEALMSAGEQQHDQQMGQQDQAHEANMGAQQQAHEASMGAADQQHEDQQASQAQEHEAAQGEQQAQTQVKIAKMKPKPAGAKKTKAKKPSGAK
jgi:hypothetical protein